MIKDLSSFEKRLLKGGGWAFTGKALSGVGGLATTAMLARLLPPTELGAYLLALSIVFTVATVARFGFELSALRHLAELMAVGSERAAKRLLWMSVAIVSVLASLSSIFLWMALDSWISTDLFQGADLARVAGPLAVWTAALTVLTLVAELFRAFHDIKMAVLCTGTLFGGLISVVVQAACFSVLLAGPGSISLEAAVTISVASTVINLAVALAVLVRRSSSLSKEGDRTISFTQLARTSLPLWVSTLGILLMTQADLWIVGAARPEEEVAAYGAAARLMKLLIMSQIVVNEVVTPIVAELNFTGERRKLERILRLTTTAAAAVSLPILVAFTFFGSGILALAFGPFYRGGGPILACLSLGWLIAVVAGSSGHVLGMLGQGKLLMRISLVTIVVAIGTALAVVQSHGALGVAASFALAQGFQSLLILLGVRWKGGVWTHMSPKIALTEISRVLFRRNVEPKVTY